MGRASAPTKSGAVATFLLLVPVLWGPVVQIGSPVSGKLWLIPTTLGWWVSAWRWQMWFVTWVPAVLAALLTAVTFDQIVAVPSFSQARRWLKVASGAALSGMISTGSFLACMVIGSQLISGIHGLRGFEEKLAGVLHEVFWMEPPAGWIYFVPLIVGAAPGAWLMSKYSSIGDMTSH